VNGEPRHASQLYEAFLEGLVLSLVLWFYTRKPRPTAAASGLFLILYGLFRIVIEFVRVPDEQLGYLSLGWVTMGQILSLPMVIIGVAMLTLALRAGPDGDGAPSAGSPPAARNAMAKKAG
jgi:phosphatidylglycerol:prolipoprotein diacylglycerol transferase